MQKTNVSLQPIREAWAENQARQLTSEAFVWVEYNITDPSLLDGISIDPKSTPKPLYFSDFPMLFNMEPKSFQVTPYATLEPNRWKLDGSMTTVPASPGASYAYPYGGYISSDCCADTGSFEKDIVITINFASSIRNLPGLSITWDSAQREYAESFEILAYYDLEENECGFYSTKENTSVVSDIDCEMLEFNRIKITIKKWNTGNRRARIEKFVLGIKTVYSKAELLKFSCSESIDPVSASLPKYEIQFEIDNQKRNFNPLSDDSLSESMMERQEIRTWYGYTLDGKEEKIPGGVYYLSEWSAPQNGLTASFKARDMLSFLNEPYQNGAFPKNSEGVSFYALATSVLEAADLPTDRKGNPLWDLSELEALCAQDDAYASANGTERTMFTKAPLPPCSMAECLQLIANASCCSIFFDREGKLHIAPLTNTDSVMTINYDNSYNKAEVSLAKQIKQFDVTMFSYKMEETEKELFSGTVELQKGYNEIEMHYSDLSGNAKTQRSVDFINGIEIVDEQYFAKRCKLAIVYNPPGTDEEDEVPPKTCMLVVRGNAIKKSEKIVTISDLPVGETQALQNELITTHTHAQKVGEWLKQNLKHRNRFTVDWRHDPRLDAGDVVSVTVGDKLQDEDPPPPPTRDVRVISSSVSFSGAFKSKIEGVEIGGDE